MKLWVSWFFSLACWTARPSPGAPYTPMFYLPGSERFSYGLCLLCCFWPLKRKNSHLHYHRRHKINNTLVTIYTYSFPFLSILQVKFLLFTPPFSIMGRGGGVKEWTSVYIYILIKFKISSDDMCRGLCISFGASSMFQDKTYWSGGCWDNSIIIISLIKVPDKHELKIFWFALDLGQVWKQ